MSGENSEIGAIILSNLDLPTSLNTQKRGQGISAGTSSNNHWGTSSAASCQFLYKISFNDLLF